MSAYTVWQNHSIYNAADTLTDEERQCDRGAFFGSIHATLNHLLWADQRWLHRLSGTPNPAQPDVPNSVREHETWEALKTARVFTDKAFIDWSMAVTEEELAGDLSWYSANDQTQLVRPKWTVVCHVYNHGTHHRGQVHAMLTAAGAKPDDTDVLYLKSEYVPWSDW